MSFVLDTCALIWWTLDPDKLSAASVEAIAQMEQEKSGYIVSISFWEIAIKLQKKKLDIGCTAREYWQLVQKIESIQIVDITTERWLTSVELDWFHRDPADRLMVSVAKELNALLITGDRIILDFYDNCIW